MRQQQQTVATLRPLIPHAPSPIQSAFLALSNEEVLFGGAAGGGKSDALLMAALQFVDVPGYSAAIFRRTKVESSRADAPLERMKRWLAPAISAGRCWWDDDANSFRFRTKEPGNEATIHFGYANTLAYLESYQGAAFQFIGIDELGAWPLAFYQYLFSRIRRTEQLKSARVPLRMRATANPGGPGHEWIKDRFVTHARHRDNGTSVRADVRARREGRPMPFPPVYLSPPSPEALELARETGRPPEKAVFVPSFAADNPGLDVLSYRSQLIRLDPARREQLEHGDWDSTSSGGFFTIASFEFVDTLPPVKRWLRSWDFAATAAEKGKDPDWTVGSKTAIWQAAYADGTFGEKRFVIGDIERFRVDPGELAPRVKAVAQQDTRRTQILMEQEPGSAGKKVIHDWATVTLYGWQVYGMLKTGPKEEYWRPLSAIAAFTPLLVLNAPWTARLVDELKALPVGHDDQADSISQAYAWLTREVDAAARARALSS